MVEPHLKTGGEATFIRPEGVGHSGSLAPSSEAIETFKQLKLKRKYRFVVFKIRGNEFVVESTGPPDSTIDDFFSKIPGSDCRYAAYDYELTTLDGRKTNKLYFVTWLPHNANPSLKMAYTTSKSGLRSTCDGCFDVNGATRHEIEEGFGIKRDTQEESGSEFEDD